MKAISGIVTAVLVLGPMLPAQASWVMVGESESGTQAFVDPTSFNYGNNRIYFRMMLTESTVSGATRESESRNLIDCKAGTLKTFRGSSKPEDIKEGTLAAEIYHYVCKRWNSR